MKVNVLEEVKDYENKPVKVSETENLKWRMVVFTALNNIVQGENLTTEEKAKCYEITQKVHAVKEPDLTIGELAFILGRIEKIYNSPLICGRAKEFFGGNKSWGNRGI